MTGLAAFSRGALRSLAVCFALAAGSQAAFAVEAPPLLPPSPPDAELLQAPEAPHPPEAEPGLRVTLEEALEMAAERSPRLDELAALMRAGAATERLARAARRPDLELAARYSRLSDVPEFAVIQPDGSRTVLFPNLPNRSGLRLGLEVPLYTGGAIKWGISSAEEMSAAAESDLRAAGAELRLEVAEAFLDTLVAGQQEEVLAEAIQAFDAHLDDVRNRLRFGLAAKSDLLAVQVQRDRAQLARLEAAGHRAVAMANLARLLGLSEEARIDPVEPADEADAEPDELSALVAQALSSRPERVAAAARVEAARARAEQTRSSLKPTVSASAGLDYARPNQLIVPPSDRWDDTWEVSVGVAYRFWDGGKRTAQVSQAQEEAIAADRRLEELDRAIRQQVVASVHELRTARAGVPVAAGGLESARENLRVTQNRFREGVIASSELLDAEVALLSSGLDHTAAKVRVLLAGEQLRRASGR